ncbi:MAG: hypothetical protein ABSC05_31430 [Candidatus Solibacter sp.]
MVIAVVAGKPLQFFQKMAARIGVAATVPHPAIGSQKPVIAVALRKGQVVADCGFVAEAAGQAEGQKLTRGFWEEL